MYFKSLVLPRLLVLQKFPCWGKFSFPDGLMLEATCATHWYWPRVKVWQSFTLAKSGSKTKPALPPFPGISIRARPEINYLRPPLWWLVMFACAQPDWLIGADSGGKGVSRHSSCHLGSWVIIRTSSVLTFHSVWHELFYTESSSRLWLFCFFTRPYPEFTLVW